VANRIASIRFSDVVLNPAEAEIRIEATPEQPSERGELRGALTGPMCAYASTVEVAYPIKPFPWQEDKPGAIVGRVVIPEPSMWDLDCPFLYEGRIELWDGTSNEDRVKLFHGLRSLRCTRQGFQLNGRYVFLHVREVASPTENELIDHRRQGINAVILAVQPGTQQLWDVCDRIGLGVLGRIQLTSQTAQQAMRLSVHPCRFGWLAKADDWDSGRSALRETLSSITPGEPIGLELDEIAEIEDQRIRFIYWRGDTMPDEQMLRLPCLVRAGHGADESKPPGIAGIVTR
jgi:hypothetical protein